LSQCWLSQIGFGHVGSFILVKVLAAANRRIARCHLPQADELEHIRQVNLSLRLQVKYRRPAKNWGH